MDGTENISERDKILFGETIDWKVRRKPKGVAMRFDKLDAEGVKKLVALGFMKLEQRMNSTPTVAEFLAFAGAMKEKGFLFYFEGFALDPREYADGGAALEAIYLNDHYPADIGLAFAKFVSPFHPDELKIDNRWLRAWWD